MSAPAYRQHKASGRAVVTLVDADTGQRRDHYLGEFGSAVSRERYYRLLAEWESRGRRFAPDAGEVVTLAHLGAKYLEHAREAMSPNDRASLETVLRLVTQYHGTTPARDFGPNALRSVRDIAVRQGFEGRKWARTYVNRQMRHVVRMYKWGVARQLVHPEHHQTLAALEPLKRGKTTAPEKPKVLPCSIDHAQAVVPFVSRQVGALIQLQALTGARGGELVQMRPCDIDRSDPSGVWIYTAKEHKTEHLDRVRLIGLGPQAQRVILPFLNRPDDQPLFSPREAAQELRRERNAARVTPPGQGNFTGSNRKIGPKKRGPGDAYTSTSYRRAVQAGCRKAGVPKWTPHQLRHAMADLVERRFDQVAASKALGHGDARITRAVYMTKDRATIVKVAKEVG